MKRVLGLLLALTVMVGMSIMPSFGQAPTPDKKTEKTEKKGDKKGDKKTDKKGDTKKKAAKKTDDKK